MDWALWIVNGALALLFVYAGGVKLARNKRDLAARDGMAWVKDYSPHTLKAIGAAEVLGAVGLVAPMVLRVAEFLAAAAAAGLLLIMAGAVVVHRRHDEPVWLPVALGGVSLVSLCLGTLASTT